MIEPGNEYLGESICHQLGPKASRLIGRLRGNVQELGGGQEYHKLYSRLFERIWLFYAQFRSNLSAQIEDHLGES